MSGKYWHSVNLFYCKSYTRGIFRTQSSNFFLTKEEWNTVAVHSNGQTLNVGDVWDIFMSLS